MGRPRKDGYREKGFPNWKTEMTRHEWLKALKQKEANLDQFIRIRILDLASIRKQIAKVEDEINGSG